MDKQRTENMSSDNEEQKIKDVRSIKKDSEDDYVPTEEDLKEKALNEQHQLQNWRSQKNAEKDSKYGDASGPESSRLPKNQQPEDAHVPQG
jgi:hypothetical protein